jgi:hypothetical protein
VCATEVAQMSKALVLKALQAVCGDAATKAIDDEVIAYVSDVVEFSVAGDDLSTSVGAMLEDFVGAKNTEAVIAFIVKEKFGDSFVNSKDVVPTTLLAGPLLMKVRFFFALSHFTLH